MSEYLKNKITEPSKTLVDQTYYEEKSSYNELKKSLSRYNDAKYYVEKAKTKFFTQAQGAEYATIETKRLDERICSPVEKEKSSQKMTSLLKEAQESEKYYQSLIQKANEQRVDSINKQNAFLELCQSIDTNLGSNFKTIVCYYIAAIKKLCSSILLDIDALSDKFKNIEIDQDIQNFIEKNKDEQKPEGEILFEPYKPMTDPYESGKAEINFQIIKEIKNYLNGVLPDFVIEKEEFLSRMRKLSKKVFTINLDLSKEEQEELHNLIQEKEKRQIFLRTLNKQRTTGKFARQERIMNYLRDILNSILEISEKDQDFGSAKNCIILSQTFYSEDKGEKHYLFESIKDNKWLKSKEFWSGLIDLMIDEEFQKNESSSKEVNDQETEQEKKRRISNIAFSQVLPYSNNMLDFRLDKKDILEVVESYIKKYDIEKDLAAAITDNINERKYDP